MSSHGPGRAGRWLDDHFGPSLKKTRSIDLLSVVACPKTVVYQGDAFDVMSLLPFLGLSGFRKYEMGDRGYKNGGASI